MNLLRQSRSDLEKIAGATKWLMTEKVDDAVWAADFNGIAKKNQDKFEKKADWKVCWGL